MCDYLNQLIVDKIKNVNKEELEYFINSKKSLLSVFKDDLPKPFLAKLTMKIMNFNLNKVSFFSIMSLLKKQNLLIFNVINDSPSGKEWLKTQINQLKNYYK